MTWPLKKKWFWLLFFALLTALMGAFMIVFVIVSLSPTSLVLTLLVVVILWYAVRSYRKWVAGTSDEENGRQEQTR